MWERPPLIRFNCSQPHCTLGGVAISGVGMTDQAVKVVNGQVGGYGGGVTVLSSKSTVKVAVDAEGHSLGGTVGRSAGGLAVVGNIEQATPDNDALELGSHSTAALAVSAAGDTTARFAVSAVGHISWGDGGVHGDKSPPTATLGTVRTAIMSWDPPLLGPNDIASVNITVTGSQPGDVLTVSLATLGFADAQVTAAVGMPDIVKVILRNVGATAVDVPAGALRVVVSTFTGSIQDRRQ